MKRSTSYALLLTCAGIIAMQPALAQKAESVATVNGKSITKIAPMRSLLGKLHRVSPIHRNCATQSKKS